MGTRSLSLPLRLVLAITVALAVTTVAADIMAVMELRKRLNASVASSLSGMVKRLARQLDQDLLSLSELIRDTAVEVGDLDNDEVVAYLQARSSALAFAFDYGVLLVNPSGEVVGDSMARDGWEGINLAAEEFFQRTFALNRPVISEPFLSPAPGGGPVVMFTAPIVDASGRIRLLLAGAVDVRHNRNLNQPTGVRASRYGQIGLFTLAGTVVAHANKDLLLERYENPLDDSLPGDDTGAIRITAADGTPTILAVARLEQVDWLLAGAFPEEEVTRPVEAGFAAAHLWFAAGLVACCVVVGMISWRLVRDLGRLSGEISRIGDDALARGQAAVDESYQGEAGMMAGAVNAMLQSLARARREIGELSYRLAGAQERERRSIAADLHDSVCQSLALANMRLGSLKKKLASSQHVDDLEAIRHIIEDSVSELRSLTFNLSPNILYELGLAPALEWFAEGFSKKYALPVTVDGADSLSEMEEGRAVFLYRAAGELLSNAAKHAGAGKLSVEVGKSGGEAFIVVSDDGRGMEKDYALATGFGLRNLRERVRQYGGTLHIDVPPGGGTRVRIGIPLVEKDSL